MAQDTEHEFQLPYVIRMTIPDEDEHSSDIDHESKYSYRCNFCHFATPAKDMIMIHINDHIFRCSLCNYSTHMQHKLLEHKNSEHKRRPPRPFDMLSLVTTERSTGTSHSCKPSLQVAESFKFCGSTMENTVHDSLFRTKCLLIPKRKAMQSTATINSSHVLKTPSTPDKSLHFDSSPHQMTTNHSIRGHVTNYVGTQEMFVPCTYSQPLESTIVPTKLTPALRSLTAYLDTGSQAEEVRNSEKISILETLDNKPLWQLTYAEIQQINVHLCDLKSRRHLSLLVDEEADDLDQLCRPEEATVTRESNSVCLQAVTPLENIKYSPVVTVSTPTKSQRRKWRSRTSIPPSLLERAELYLHPTLVEKEEEQLRDVLDHVEVECVNDSIGVADMESQSRRTSRRCSLRNQGMTKPVNKAKKAVQTSGSSIVGRDHYEFAESDEELNECHWNTSLKTNRSRSNFSRSSLHRGMTDSLVEDEDQCTTANLVALENIPRQSPIIQTTRTPFSSKENGLTGVVDNKSPTSKKYEPKNLHPPKQMVSNSTPFCAHDMFSLSDEEPSMVPLILAPEGLPIAKSTASALSTVKDAEKTTKGREIRSNICAEDIRTLAKQHSKIKRHTFVVSKGKFVISKTETYPVKSTDLNLLRHTSTELSSLDVSTSRTRNKGCTSLANTTKTNLPPLKPAQTSTSESEHIPASPSSLTLARALAIDEITQLSQKEETITNSCERREALLASETFMPILPAAPCSSGVTPVVVPAKSPAKSPAKVSRKRSKRSNVPDNPVRKAPRRERSLLKTALQSLLQPHLDSRGTKRVTFSFTDLSDADTLPECLLNIKTRHCTPSPVRRSPSQQGALEVEELAAVIMQVVSPLDTSISTAESCNAISGYGDKPELELPLCIPSVTHANSLVSGATAFTTTSPLSSVRVEQATSKVIHQPADLLRAPVCEYVIPTCGASPLPRVHSSNVKRVIYSQYRIRCPVISEHVSLHSAQLISPVALSVCNVTTESPLQYAVLHDKQVFQSCLPLASVGIQSVDPHLCHLPQLECASEVVVPFDQIIAHQVSLKTAYHVIDGETDLSPSVSRAYTTQSSSIPSNASDVSTDYQFSDRELDSDADAAELFESKTIVRSNSVDEYIVDSTAPLMDSTSPLIDSTTPIADSTALVDDSHNQVTSTSLDLTPNHTHKTRVTSTTPEKGAHVGSNQFVFHSTILQHPPLELVKVQVSPKIVDIQQEACLTYLETRVCPSTSSKPDVTSATDQDNDALPRSSEADAAKAPFGSLKSKLQLAYKKAMIKKTNVSKSVEDISSSKTSASSSDKSSKLKKKKKENKKESKHKRRKHKSREQSPPSKSTGHSSLTIKSPQKCKSTSKKSKKEMIPLEDTLIFYDVPSSAANSVSKESTTILPKSSQTNCSNKKRKRDKSLENDSKQKKSKLTVNGGSKQNQKNKNSSYTKLEGEGVKVPWSNRKITEICRCDMCDFISIEKSDLREHKKEMHSNKDPMATLTPCEYDPPINSDVQYKCSLCGLSDQLLRNIRQHITVEHNGKIPSCERVTHKRKEVGFSLLVESVRVFK